MTKRKPNYGKISMRAVADIAKADKFEKQFHKEYYPLFQQFNGKPVSKLSMTDKRIFYTFLKLATVESRAQAYFEYTAALLGVISEGLPLLSRNIHGNREDSAKLKVMESKLKSIRREQAKLMELYDGIEDIKNSFENFIQKKTQQMEQAEEAKHGRMSTTPKRTTQSEHL